jgi:hypothetical protein
MFESSSIEYCTDEEVFKSGPIYCAASGGIFLKNFIFFLFLAESEMIRRRSQRVCENRTAKRVLQDSRCSQVSERRNVSDECEKDLGRGLPKWLRDRSAGSEDAGVRWERRSGCDERLKARS